MEYCGYGVKHYIINQSTDTGGRSSNNTTLFTIKKQLLPKQNFMKICLPDKHLVSQIYSINHRTEFSRVVRNRQNEGLLEHRLPCLPTS